jgi:hypothetical protein
MPLEGLESVLDYFDTMSDVAYEATIIGGESLAGDMSNRIHKQGKDSAGSNIAEGYSTKPYFTDIERLPSTGRIPKNLISKNGRWVRLPKGYSDLRRFSGRGQRVNLDLTGHLRTSLRFRIEPEGFSLGFLGGDSDDSGVTAGEKAGFLESLYNKDIFTPSDEEIDEAVKDITFEWVNRNV